MKDPWVCSSDTVRNINPNIVHGIVHTMCQQNLNHVRCSGSLFKPNESTDDREGL